MCGRFTRMYTWQELVSLYHLSVPAMTNFQPRYNICPTDTIDEDVLQRWPVFRRVNSSRADDADATLIDKIELPA